MQEQQEREFVERHEELPPTWEALGGQAWQEQGNGAAVLKRVAPFRLRWLEKSVTPFRLAHSSKTPHRRAGGGGERRGRGSRNPGRKPGGLRGRWLPRSMSRNHARFNRGKENPERDPEAQQGTIFVTAPLSKTEDFLPGRAESWPWKPRGTGETLT